MTKRYGYNNIEGVVERRDGGLVLYSDYENLVRVLEFIRESDPDCECNFHGRDTTTMLCCINTDTFCVRCIAGTALKEQS